MDKTVKLELSVVEAETLIMSLMDRVMLYEQGEVKEGSVDEIEIKKAQKLFMKIKKVFKLKKVFEY